MKTKIFAVGSPMFLLFLTFVYSGKGVSPVEPLVTTPTQCPPCGPDLCLSDSRYPPKLAKKKADMKGKFPDDLIALLDRDGKCVMAIDQSPDTFRLLLVEKNGDNTSIEWTQDHEDLARKKVLSGDLKAYYKHNVRKVFACCGEPKAEARTDWDSKLGLSRNLSIVCTKQGSAVVCE
jgi:hypothetical protein